MKPLKHKLALTLFLASMTVGIQAQETQRDTDTTCCLAVEWIAPLTTTAAQEDGPFGSRANEWRAAPSAPAQDRYEAAAQSDTDEACCLAKEWHAS